MKEIKFELTALQKEFIEEKLGVKNMDDVKIIFDVNSENSESITKEFTNKSTRVSFTLCPCGDGSWSWLCC